MDTLPLASGGTPVKIYAPTPRPGVKKNIRGKILFDTRIDIALHLVAQFSDARRRSVMILLDKGFDPVVERVTNFGQFDDVVFHDGSPKW